MIRELTFEDFAAWKALRLEALQTYPQMFAGSYAEEFQRTDAEWKSDFRPNTHIFGAFDGEGGKPAGIAGYYALDNVKRRHRGEVFTTYMRKEFRGKGLMDGLLQLLCAQAKKTGIEQLQLDVSTNALSAVRCYKRNDFTIYATKPRTLKISTNYINTYMMIKYL